MSFWYLRGEVKAANLLKRLSAEAGSELWTGALQRAEILFFMRSEEERATLSFLSRSRPSR